LGTREISKSLLETLFSSSGVCSSIHKKLEKKNRTLFLSLIHCSIVVLGTILLLQVYTKKNMVQKEIYAIYSIETFFVSDDHRDFFCNSDWAEQEQLLQDSSFSECIMHTVKKLSRFQLACRLPLEPVRIFSNMALAKKMNKQKHQQLRKIAPRWFLVFFRFCN